MNFLPLAISFAAGVYCAKYIPVFTAIIAVIFFIILISISKRKLAADAAVMAIAAVFGMCLYHGASVPDKGSEFAGKYITLHGHICDIPYDNHGINRYTMHVNELTFNNNTTALNTKVIVNSEKNFNCGDSVSVMGKLELIDESSHDDVFNSKNYFAARGIYFKTTALEASHSAFRYSNLSPSYAANILRSKCSEMIKRHYSGDIAAAMITIITGDRHGFSDNYDDILDRTGMRHIFYPAFVHIMLITFLIGLTQSFVPRRIRDYLLIIILILYMLTAASLSSVKAASVLITLILCKRLFGSGNFINSLSLFVLISGIANPMLFFDAGFVYSIAASFILNRFMPLFRGKSPLQKFIGRYIIFVVGLAPLTIYLFGRISIYSFIASVLFIPILMLILVISPLFLLNCAFGTTLPFAWIADKFVMFLLHIPVFIDKLPFASITLPKPTFLLIAGFYTAMAALWYHKSYFADKARICAVIATGLIASQLFYTVRDFGKIKVNFIDVGQGDATLVQMPFKGNILIDGGGGSVYSTYNVGENVFVPYLTEHGANIIQAAFVSHYHKDHVEGIIAAIESLTVKNLFLPDITPDDELRSSLEKAAGENGTKIHYVSEPMQVSIDDALLEVIPPGNDVTFSNDPNDGSLYINMKYGEFNCIFTGDMTHKGENYLLDNNLVSDAEVLKVAHHGSFTSTTAGMIDAVSPDYSLIGVGKDNNYGHPDDDVIKRLKNSRILRTDECGSITLAADRFGNISVRCDY